MPRRMTKLEMYGLVERVLDMYKKENMSMQEITDALKAEGFDISRESIRKKIRTSKQLADIYEKSLEESGILLKTVRDNPNTDIIETTTSLLAHHLFQFAKKIDSLEFTDSESFTRAVNEVSQAQVRVAKLRLDYQKGFEHAKREVIKKLNDELNQFPDLRDRLAEVITNQIKSGCENLL